MPWPAVILHEPMTVFTDFILAALSAWWARRLAQSGKTGISTAGGNWTWALAASAAAAFFGGVSHGFPALPRPLPWLLWKSVQTAIGLAAFFTVRATALSRLPPRASRAALRLAAAQLALYLAWAAYYDDFIYSIVDYGAAFVFALVAHLPAALRRADPAARAIAGGIVVCFAGAAIQAAGIAPHPHFNHNDLYHVIQMLGTWLIYRGALRAAAADNG